MNATSNREDAIELPTPAQQGAAAAIGTGSGVARFISPTADLTHKPGAETDSWFLVSHLNCERGPLDLMVHYIRNSPTGGKAFVQAIMSVLDWKTKRSLAEEVDYDAFDPGISMSTEAFDVRTPSGTMSGDSSFMHVTAEFREIGADLRLTRTGPVMANQSNGILPIWGALQYHYSFPTMRAEGTVTFNGETYEVAGPSWFDRQWGPLGPRFYGVKWNWMGISLDNGVRISMWDIVDTTAEHAYATVLHPNGLHEVVDVDSVIDGQDPWQSPDTGRVYPTKWTLSIPMLDANFRIEPEVRQQEVVSPLEAQYSPVKTHKYEGASSVTGTMRGEEVTGHAIIELVGAWN